MNKKHLPFFVIFLSSCMLLCSTSSAETKQKTPHLINEQSDFNGEIISGDKGKRLDAFLNKTPFTGSMLIYKQGEIILAKGYRWANREKKIPNSRETLYTIASLSKPFTAAAILQLEERGKLKINDLFNKYMKNVPEDKKTITIAHLLSHTSGFRDNRLKLQGLNRKTFDDIFKRTMSTKLGSIPGEKGVYSNVGYVMLGIVIEVASGVPFEKYMKENIFKPAGMLHTGFLNDGFVDKNKTASGYIMYKGKPRDTGSCATLPFGWLNRGCAGIVSSVDDLMRFASVMHTDKILKSEHRKKWLDPIPEWQKTFKKIRSYGWALGRTREGHFIYQHNGLNPRGWGGGFMSIPAKDTVIIIQSNFIGVSQNGIMQGIQAIIFGAKLKISRVVPDSQAEKQGIKAGDILISFNGKKVNSHVELVAAIKGAKDKPESVLTVERDGKLLSFKVKPGPIGINF